MRSDESTDPKVSVIIPWRSDHGERERIFNWIIERWKKIYTFPCIEIIYGDSGDEIFNRGKSRNILADAATTDLLIFADGDTIPTKAYIDQAILIARYNQWAIAYDVERYYNLSSTASEVLLSGKPFACIPEPIEGNYDHKITSFSGMFVILKEDFNNVRYDERFTGWGHEDVAFFIKATAILGDPKRVQGFVSHLYHSRTNADFNTLEEVLNRELFNTEYQQKYKWNDPRIK